MPDTSGCAYDDTQLNWLAPGGLERGTCGLERGTCGLERGTCGLP